MSELSALPPDDIVEISTNFFQWMYNYLILTLGSWNMITKINFQIYFLDKTKWNWIEFQSISLLMTNKL